MSEVLSSSSNLSTLPLKLYSKSKEGGEGSGRHRGARIYQSNKAYRALTPSGHNIGPYKDAEKLKAHLDSFEKEFKLEPKSKEADSATTQVAQLKTQESKKSFKVSLREANNSPFKNHTFQSILIREGMGNFKDRFFYTKEALQKAAESKLFEGVQCFVDHPTEIDEQIQPERSTRDILGYYEKVQYEEGDDGAGRLVANLCVGNSVSLDWAMSLLTNSIDYSTKFKETDLVGLSINASGSANPVQIDEWMQSQQLSASIIEKLNEAKAEGITEINIVNELTDAQSVDLVTKAGAGGKILKMLEMEKKMAKKFFESEGEKHEKKHHEDGAKDATAMAPGSAGTPDHADEDQDKALFAKMIKQYLGKDDADADEMEMAKHAYEAHKEDGMESHEAYEAAGKHLKMAMAIGKKMSQGKQSETESEGEAKHESESESESEGHKEGQTPPPSPKSTDSKKKESHQVIQLSGEVAKLRESLKQYELRDHLDKKLKESGHSNAFTKKFREALGEPKSKAQIDQMWKVFLKAADAGVEEVGADSDVFVIEKQNYKESDNSSGKINFSDCLR